MKRWLPIALVLGVVVAGLVSIFFPGLIAWGTPAPLVLPGIVEIQEVRLASKVGGRIERILVREGERVQPGQKAIVFEAPELLNEKEQLKAKLEAAEAEYLRAQTGPRPEEKEAARAAAEAAKARYERLKAGWRDEEKRQAASELESAAADLKLAKEELERTVELYRMKSVAKAELDTARAAHDRALGQVRATQSKVEMYAAGSRQEDIAEAKATWEQMVAKWQELLAGTRTEDILLARAKRDEAAAKLREVDIRLDETVVRVPNDPAFIDAVVEVVPFRVGDVVPPNQPVLRLLCVKDLWVKTFVPETKLHRIRVGQKVKVRVDSEDNKTFDGEIIFRANSSEFTPRNVQSVDERRYQMFALKVRVDDPQGVLNSGMAAQVTVP